MSSVLARRAKSRHFDAHGQPLLLPKPVKSAAKGAKSRYSEKASLIAPKKPRGKGK
jgi:hypothetical protein